MKISMKKRFAAFALIGALAAPFGMAASASAQDRDRPARTERRVYDRTHKDYHVWNDHEGQAYRSWLGERQLKYRDYGRLQHKQQNEYWQWRHDHPER
jgi:hypothetical protein